MTSPVGPSTAIYLDVEDMLVPSTPDQQVSLQRTLVRVRELAQKGASLYLWSRQGAAQARRVAAELGIEACFQAFLPKPQVLVDSQSLEDWKISEIPPVAFNVVRVEDLLRIQRG